MKLAPSRFPQLCLLHCLDCHENMQRIFVLSKLDVSSCDKCGGDQFALFVPMSPICMN